MSPCSSLFASLFPLLSFTPSWHDPFVLVTSHKLTPTCRDRARARATWANSARANVLCRQEGVGEVGNCVDLLPFPYLRVLSSHPEWSFTDQTRSAKRLEVWATAHAVKCLPNIQKGQESELRIPARDEDPMVPTLCLPTLGGSMLGRDSWI
jgi:hypothetical protein